MTTADPTSRQRLLRRGFALEYATSGWNIVGLVVLAVTAVAAQSVALAGFGLGLADRDRRVDRGDLGTVWHRAGPATAGTALALNAGLGWWWTDLRILTDDSAESITSGDLDIA